MTERVQWAIRYCPESGPSYLTTHNGAVVYFPTAADAWIAMWEWRKRERVGSYKAVRITTRPSLSPEVKAAREKLCEAAVRYSDDVRRIGYLEAAAADYAKAVRR
jgi:hypothetical protein